MKKIYVLICGIFIVLSFSGVLAADFRISKSPQTINVNGNTKEFEVYNINGNNFFKLRDIAYVLNGTGSEFSVDYNEESRLIQLVKGKEYVPNGSEMKNGVDNSDKAKQSTQKLSINDEDKELLAYNIAGNNFFKLRDLGKELDFNVDYEQATNTVIIESKKEEAIVNITNVEKTEYDGKLCVAITGDTPINSYKNFDMFDDENKRIVVDIQNTNVSIEHSTIEVNEGNIIRIRIGNQGGGLNRFVIDLNDSIEYKVIQSSDKKTLYVVLTTKVLTTSTEVIDVVESGENIVIDDTTKTENSTSDENELSQNNEEKTTIEQTDNNEEKNSTPKYTEEDLNNRVKIMSVKYSSTNNTIKVNATDTFEYSKSLEEKPYKIIFDIENAVLSVEGPTIISPKNKLINKIEFYQFDEMTVRVEITTSSKPDYSESMKDKELQILVDEPTYQNLVYSSSSSSGVVTLSDIKKEVFSTTENTDSNTYTIRYSESIFTCGKENLTINDEFLKLIKISTGKIILEGKSDVNFEMEQSGNNVVVKITKKSPVKIDLSNSTGSSTSSNTKNESSNTNTTTVSQGKHRYTVNRTSTFNVTKINDTRCLVGKAYVNNTSGPNFDFNLLSKKSNIAINSNTNILIYHTHTTEGYLESGIDSNFHSTDFSKGVVVAGNTLEKYLQQKNIKVYHDTKRHDTDYNNSYDDSLEYMKKLMKKETYDITIDLHRDAISSNLYYGPSATINGKKCAKLMFVMGSNAYGLEHPNWIENLKVAILIQNKAEEMYPGLFRDISLVRWRYNEHLSPGGMLIEAGATGNSVEEVNNSMKYLADVFAALSN